MSARPATGGRRKGDAALLVPAREALALLRHMHRASGGRLHGALALLLLVGALEGLSLLLIVPLLHLAQKGGGAINLERVGQDVAALSWLPAVSVPLAAVLAALVALVAAQAVLNRGKAVRLQRLLDDFTNAMRLGLFDAIGRARWSSIARARTSDLEHVLTGDVDRLQGAGFMALSIVQTLVLMGCYTVLALLVSVPMTLLSGAIGVALLVLLAPFRHAAARFGERAVLNRQAQYRTVAEFLGALKIAKAMNAEPRYLERLDRTLGEMADHSRRFAAQNATSGAVFTVLSTAAIALFAWIAIVVVELSLAQIVVLTVLFARVTPRFMMLQTQVQQLLAVLPAYRLVTDAIAVHEAATEPRLAPTTPTGGPGPCELAFEGVTLRYEGSERDALHAVDLVLPAGSTTALIGPSGAGKSTFVDLAIGLLRPDGGTVRVDGQALDERSRRPWRERVAYVPQDVALIHDTVAANLRLAAPDATATEMRDALGRAEALDFVERLPGGLEATIGERGTSLSGGERQRLALARAFLREPDLLVLDEATSAMDHETQGAIVSALRALGGRTTILLVAHRPSVIALADRVASLEAGRIVEAGTASELAADPRSRLRAALGGEATHLAVVSAPGPAEREEAA